MPYQENYWQCDSKNLDLLPLKVIVKSKNGNETITFPLITSLLEVRMRDCLGKYHLDLIPEDIMSIFQKWKLLWHELSKIQSISKKLLSTCTPRLVLGMMIEKILLVWLCLRHKVNKFSA